MDDFYGVGVQVKETCGTVVRAGGSADGVSWIRDSVAGVNWARCDRCQPVSGGPGGCRVD